MTAERINGVKLNVERLSDEELFNALEHTTVRYEEVKADLERLLGVANERGLVRVGDE